ncbi:MAG: hypothetical protein DMF66_17315 [Acidobacteria bacterium]|nr:MAG: hypothetical protein DMF66_17315 [Acidobacteriota bacterium]
MQQRLINGRTESAELRDLVHSGLQRERYRQATSDPAIRELLRTFQEMLDHSLSQAEERLAARLRIESSIAANYLARIYPLALFAAEALRQLPADTAPDDLRAKALEHYNALYEEVEVEARQYTEQAVTRRDEASAKVREAWEAGAPLPPAVAGSQNP